MILFLDTEKSNSFRQAQTNMHRANQHARIKREPGYQPPGHQLPRDEEDDNLTVDFAPSEAERRMQRSDARKSQIALLELSLVIEN